MKKATLIFLAALALIISSSAVTLHTVTTKEKVEQPFQPLPKFKGLSRFDIDPCHQKRAHFRNADVSRNDFVYDLKFETRR